MRWVCLTASIGLALAGCGRFGFDDLSATDARDGAGDGDGAVVGCGLIDLAVGARSSCAIKGAGELWCWGAIGGKQGPTHIPLGVAARKVVMGHDHACVMLETQQVRCIGNGGLGQLGQGVYEDSATPVAPVGDRAYREIAASKNTTCAALTNGGVECWGDDGGGELGDSPTESSTNSPVAASGLAGFTFDVLAGGSGSICARTTAGAWWCWGNVSFRDDSSQPTPVPVAITAASVGLMGTAACSLDQGAVRCAGHAESGELGTGVIEQKSYSGVGLGLTNVVQIAGGRNAQCAVQRSGEALCWGRNRSGELGTGTVSLESTPRRLELPPTLRIATAFRHGCAETNQGVYCWGANHNNQLGRGTSGVNLTGLAIPGLPGSIAEVGVTISSGFGCARTTTGAVWCWGQNYHGTTGNPDRTSSTTASQIVLPQPASQIALGEGFACARLADRVMCWGVNQYGGLGDSTDGIRATPGMVPGVGATSLIVGGNHGACVVDASNVALCWGKRDNDQMNAPRPIPGLPPVQTITWQPYSAPFGHQCALDLAGNAWCWGQNDDGELGRNTITMGEPVPAQVAGTVQFSAIATKIGYAGLTCAIQAAPPRDLYCWGRYNGAAVPTPTRIPGIDPVRIDGGSVLCVTVAGNTRYCIGGALNGEFGDGMEQNSTTDLFQLVTHPAEAMALGFGGACFVEAGNVRCVGETRFGALGAATQIAMPAAVPLSCQ